MRRMFTGLVEEVAAVVEARRAGDRSSGYTLALTVKAPLVAKGANVGDSIAVSGCCLTVVKKKGSLLSFDAGSETLSRTNFDRLQPGSEVNLERSLAVGDRLGGHLVTGHIDGVGTLIRRRDDDQWSHFIVRAPARLTRQMASKGSVAVEGVSLTLVNVEADRFSVALIPHTLTHTTLGKLQVGGVVNIETDLLAKYVEKQLESRRIELAESGIRVREE
jgi:riboflavin synthase